MKTFAFDLDRTKEMLAFSTLKEAMNIGNGWFIACNADDIRESGVPMSLLVQFYNSHNQANPIKNFRDRKTAAERLLALAEAKAKVVKSATPEKEMSTEKKSNGSRRGRISKFEGKVIKLSPDIKINPRRETSFGYKSMEIVIAAKNGITYEEYIRKGGRRQDLAWDIAHGYVTIN